ncbi:NifU family protein [Solitalea sp. MAHUQ-68]|uniref:NifU family protein n=1 Tax=Solitalea agri TaxID=2953739 RepID=A0A9X2F2V2_9SPHI|nr:NifU family protein [Solitalea agri]MCO4293699.1 NifU family protein [Solitalea agri]
MSLTATVNVYTEITPNPATMKFITNKLLINGSKDFATKESAEDSPFAKELFKFSFVDGVFFASNFVTITKVAGSDWEDLTPILKEFVKGAVESELKIVNDHNEEVIFEGTETEKKIQQILHDYVRPAVEQDGGAIHYKSFDEAGVVTVELKGSCSGCPSSTITLKAGIENLLKRMVPEVTEVIAEAM